MSYCFCQKSFTNSIKSRSIICFWTWVFNPLKCFRIRNISKGVNQRLKNICFHNFNSTYMNKLFFRFCSFYQSIHIWKKCSISYIPSPVKAIRSISSLIIVTKHTCHPCQLHPSRLSSTEITCKIHLDFIEI